MEATSDVDLQKKIDELKRQKEQLDAQKAVLDADKAKRESERALANVNEEFSRRLNDLQNQKALAEANKALAEAQKGLEQSKDSTAQQIAQLQHQKSLADAQKALADSQKALDQTKSGSAQQLTDLQSQKAIADAQKALSDAQTQSVVARLIGDVKAGPYSGTVDMKPNAGTEEALLLGARAIKEAAAKVALAVTGIQTAPLSIHIFAAKEFPNFQRLLTYRFRKELIKQAFGAAGVEKPKAPKVGLEAVATPALVSAGLDAFSKILGFFKSDYAVGGLEVKLDESLLLYSVAGRLVAREVHLPLVYAPVAQTGAIVALAAELSELVELRGRAAMQLDEMNKQIADLKKQAAELEKQPDGTDAAVEDGSKKDEILRVIARIKPKTDQLNGVIALYDAFASSLTTPDANGTVPVSVLVQEHAVDAALKAGAGVLLLRLENTGGGYLLKKNLLTGLGAEIPLYHMGGATVTYLLLAGADGKVLGGDVVTIHGGFVRTDKLRGELQK
jgi:hypothetical protein